MFFLEKKLVGWGSKGEEEEDGKAEVVAHEIAYQPYGDAEDGEVFVVEECGDEGTKGGELMSATEVTRVESPSRWRSRARSIWMRSEAKMMKRMYQRMLRLPERSS